MANPESKPTAKLARAHAVLRDVVRSGGKDNWSHLHSHGHSFSTVWACVNRGWLKAEGRYRYELTDTGSQEVSPA